MAGAFANSQNLVAIKDIRKDTLLLRNGGICRVLIVGGTNFSLKSEEEQNMLTTAYQNFLNSIDFSLQMLVHSRKINIDHYLEDLGKRLEDELSPILKNQISEYREFIREFVSENAIMEKMFFVVVPWHPAAMPKPSSGGFKLPFFGKNKEQAPADKEKEERQSEDAKSDKLLEDNLPQLEQRVAQVMSGLNQLGLEAAVLKTEELAELFFNFYNPGSVEREAATAARVEAKKE